MKGGTLVATYQGEPQGLDPAIDWEGQGWAIEHCLFNTFLQYAAKPGTAGTEMLPDLATEVPTQENGGIADSGTTYTFHLKHGIKFAPPVDREVTSADFKYSFERMMADPKAPATGFYTGVVGAEAFMAGKAKHIAGYQTPDPYTVVIKLEQPDMAFMGAMTMSFTDVVAREWVEKWGRQINRHPLGTGPYMFDHWTAGREILVQRNPNYYAPDAVYLDAVRFEFSLNPSTAVLKLQRGDVNVLGDYIPPADYVRVKTDPKFSKLVAEEPVIAIDYLFLNRTVKPFDDLKVRQAISMAIDRTCIIKLSERRRRPPDPAVPGRAAGHQDGAAGEFYPYDVAKAKSLLAEAGFPDGFKTTLYSHNVDPWPKVLQSVQQDLREIGIASDLKVLDRAAIRAGRPQGDGHPGRHQGARPCHLLDAHRQTWGRRHRPQRLVDGLPRPRATSSSRCRAKLGHRGGHQPELLVGSPGGDAASQRRRPTPTARPRGSTSSCEIQDVIMAQAPSVPLYQPKVNSVHTAGCGQLLPPPGVDLRLPGVLLHRGAVS